MQYKYRWVYAILLLTLIAVSGFIFIILPLENSIRLLVANKANLLEQIKQNKLANTQSKVNSSETTKNRNFIDRNKIFLRDVLVLLPANGLILHSISFTSNELTELTASEILHLTLEGDFFQFSNFIFNLIHQISDVIFTNFELQVNNKGRLNINLELLLINLNNFSFHNEASLKTSKIFNLKFARDPFCHLQTNTITEMNTSIYSLKQMKLIGVIQQSGKSQAFILLPNEAIAVVDTSTRLGRESAKVIDIKPNKMVVELPNKKKMELYL